MPTERKWLALPALIIADLSLLIAWIPLINELALAGVLLTIILAGLSLVINRKRLKTLTTTSLVTALVSLLLVLASRLLLEQSLANLDQVLQELNTYLTSILKHLPFFA